MLDIEKPKIHQLVIGEVTKIMRFGAYCKLPEYNGLEVFLPLREISSGWIKNIHEYLHTGQKSVFKVTYYDKERGTVDVSLKQVTPKEEKEKMGGYRLEKRVEALFGQIVKTTKNTAKMEELKHQALGQFTSFAKLAYNAVNNTEEYKNSTLPKKLKDSLVEALEAGKKNRQFIVSYIVTLLDYNTKSGVSELKGIFSDVRSKGVSIRYISAPKYRFTAEGKDYPDAESKIKDAVTAINSKITNSVTFKMEKEKLKRENASILDSYA